MKAEYDWRREASRVESFGLFLTTLCGSCSGPKAGPSRSNCREGGNHASDIAEHRNPPAGEDR